MTKFKLLCIFLFSFFTFASHNFAFGQRFGYVDVEFILNKMPDYAEAQAEIDKISLQWQDEIQKKYKEIEAMYNKLKAEEVLLTKELRDEKLNQIRKEENNVKEYHRKVFGYEGLLFLKKKELVKPLHDRVYKAVGKVAKDNRLQMVFDKSGDLVMIYTDPIYDFTESVLDELGLSEENENETK
ncbi:OmpH family outer membrane protein [Fulvivirgaceae bacterium BMA10]|uniref:OmpH family outer membrane protein n=1 Tax=Splendidivirga corallicola TaxID=3051826 RepID=A0ABT8KLG6_9BACT|nr:OmpH family outer membrane protein [Fulvivirgaceae bacterium BMA10]